MEKESTCGVLYEILCHNCEIKYMGVIGRKFKLGEHQKDAKNVPQVYTRSERKSSETCFNKNAVTYMYHTCIMKANHFMGGGWVGWEQKVLDRENNQRF